MKFKRTDVGDGNNDFLAHNANFPRRILELASITIVQQKRGRLSDVCESFSWMLRGVVQFFYSNYVGQGSGGV